MNEAEARELCAVREGEQPGHHWIVQQRGGEWVVARLPGGARIAPASIEAGKGEPEDVGDDPRPAIMRNIPPYGPGL
jgi:hypothetical protein